MQYMHALIQRSIQRAGLSLPFLTPRARDLITLIPALFSEGSPSIGIYGHRACSRAEYGRLRSVLGRRPDIVMGRLPDRVMLESLIVLVRPCLGSEHQVSVLTVLCVREDKAREEISVKASILSALFAENGIPMSTLISSEELPQLLVYEIMLTGIVLGGKQPVTRKGSDQELCIYIGSLPGTITDACRPAYTEWNPFRHFLDSRQDDFIGRGDFPSAMSVPGAHPFILPYLHILHRDEERLDTENIEKMRMSLLLLYSGFPPAEEAMRAFRTAWKAESAYPRVSGLGFTEAMKLRQWLVPFGQDELPVFSWPPQRHFRRDRLNLAWDGNHWHTGEPAGLRHRHAWVVLVWAALAGLIGKTTRICAPKDLLLKPGSSALLLNAVKTFKEGVEILVPEDTMQGSIQARKGRFYYSASPFALLDQGKKHSVELFEAVKKKALLDDIDLKTNKNE